METKKRIPEGSMRKRREAMKAMAEAGKALLKAQGQCGFFPLPEKYNLVALQVQEFIQWRNSQVFRVEPQSKPEDLF